MASTQESVIRKLKSSLIAIPQTFNTNNEDIYGHYEYQPNCHIIQGGQERGMLDQHTQDKTQEQASFNYMSSEQQTPLEEEAALIQEDVNAIANTTQDANDNVYNPSYFTSPEVKIRRKKPKRNTSQSVEHYQRRASSQNKSPYFNKSMTSGQESSQMMNGTSRKDSLFHVLWKLQKASQSELSSGQTTAYKNFTNVSEQQRFKKTLQQFNTLKSQMAEATEIEEALHTLRCFLSKILDSTQQKMVRAINDEEMTQLAEQIINTDVQKFDPKYSIQQIVERLISGQDFLDDPEEAFRDFKNHLSRVQYKRQQLDEIEKRSNPVVNEKRLDNICTDQKFYDVSDVFWSTQNPSNLASMYQKQTEKINAECSNINRLNYYINLNKKVSHPEVPTPYFVRSFPFVSRVGLNKASHQQPRKKKTSTKNTNQKDSKPATSTEPIKSPPAQQQQIHQSTNIKPYKAISKTNDIRHLISNKCVSEIEENSIIQRNKLFLEHVICERSKIKEMGTHSQKNSSTAQRRPPSSLNKRNPLLMIDSKLQDDKDNGMVFLKNERLIYF